MARFSGDSVPATSATLSTPIAIAADSAGNLYVSDTANNRVRKISGTTLVTVAGTGFQGFSGDNGPATSASLNFPVGVVLDGAGNLFIYDSNNNRIRKVTAGTITTVAGNGNSGFSGDGG